MDVDVEPALMRRSMVTSQLRTNAVSDQRVVAAMAKVPREDYLPEGVRAVAYRDTTIPVGGGRYANPPMATGRLLTEAALLAGDRVLLIGAAGGYTAAVLSHIVAAVFAVESDAALANLSRTAFRLSPKVTLVEGPLSGGAPDAAPFDVLIIDGAVEELPASLIEQVRAGGRVVAGLLDLGITRLAAGRRTEGGFGLQPFADAECAILPGFAPAPRFHF